MQLDKFTDYGLRLLIALAAHAPDKLSSSAIAGMFSVSEHHLSKVASALVHEGFVHASRGRGGGLTLARAPEEISIGAVVRHLGRNQAVVECFTSNPTGPSCAILPLCGLRGPLSEAQDAFYQVLDTYSLADVSKNRAGLAGLLTPE